MSKWVDMDTGREFAQRENVEVIQAFEQGHDIACYDYDQEKQAWVYQYSYRRERSE